MRAVPAAVFQWAEAQVGKAMRCSPDQATKPGDAYGRVVDWKPDTTGHGVYFVLDRGAGRRDRQRWVERYRLLPPHLQAPRTRASR